MNPLVSKYKNELNLGICLIGSNLNLLVVRGFAPLNFLADISQADVFDEIRNPNGTQRELSKPKAEQALEYAMESEFVANMADPRSFPEVILNVRDVSVISVLEKGNVWDFNSFIDSKSDETILVDLKVNVDKLIWPKKEYDPQIARVDGNHRLAYSESDFGSDEDNEDLPSVPFAIFIGLSTLQERKLFEDINSNQKGMDASITQSFRMDASSDFQLISEPKNRALWMAKYLSKDGNAFEGKVFSGGSTKGVKEKYGEVPPVKINSLRRAITLTMSTADELDALYFPPLEPGEDIGSEAYKNKLLNSAQDYVELLNRYWQAVKNAYPDAWQNRKDYILMQSIGLEGFSYLAAKIITERFHEKAVAQKDFDVALEDFADKFKLDRDNFKGVAGAGGGRHVFNLAINAVSKNNSQVSVVRKRLGLNQTFLSTDE